MNYSISKKQNYLFLGLVIVTIIISMITYRTTQKKWVLYSDAENKFRKKSFEQAIVVYQKSLDIGATSPLAYLHLADSYVAVGNFSEGIKFYHMYLEIYPDDQDVRLLLARALSWNGNIKESVEEYHKILKNPPEN